MTDVNKIVAAILTAGRVPTTTQPGASMEMADWLAEYQAWLKALEGLDDGSKAPSYESISERAFGDQNANRT